MTVEWSRDWIKAVSIGRGGISTYGDHSTGSGYVREDLKQLTGRPAVDTTGIPFDRMISLSFASPLLDTAIIDPVAAPEIPDYMLGDYGLQGEFKTVATLAKLGGMNLGKVGLADWLQYWRDAGAIVGTIQADGSIA